MNLTLFHHRGWYVKSKKIKLGYTEMELNSEIFFKMSRRYIEMRGANLRHRYIYKITANI